MCQRVQMDGIWCTTPGLHLHERGVWRYAMMGLRVMDQGISRISVIYSFRFMLSHFWIKVGGTFSFKKNIPVRYHCTLNAHAICVLTFLLKLRWRGYHGIVRTCATAVNLVMEKTDDLVLTVKQQVNGHRFLYWCIAHSLQLRCLPFAVFQIWFCSPFCLSTAPESGHCRLGSPIFGHSGC